MTALDAPARKRDRAGFVPTIGQWFEDHPEWLILTIAALAWIPLLWTLAGTFTLDHHHGPAAAPEPIGGYDTHLAMWSMMAVAMMLPTTVPHLRYIGFGTRVSRRQRSILLFALSYLTAWTLPGFAIALVPQPAAPVAVVIAVLFAAGWELTPVKRRALRACCRTSPVRYRGPVADSAAAEYGLRHGGRCLLGSGPAMIALMLGGHPWWATVALALVMAGQKLLSEPVRWQTVVALGWLGAALAVTGVALFD